MNETLSWFASVLRQPINQDSELMPSELSLKADHYISPSPTLEPFSRIEIYAQQYWWRFFNTLQDQYPLVTRLFGANGFNKQIATPYILAFPPRHWNINTLGEDLVKWVDAHYNESDAVLIRAAARLDWGYIAAFLGTTASLPSTEHQTLYLSSTTFLFELKWDLFAFRKIVVAEEADYWIDQDFPELKKEETYYFVMHRNVKGFVKVDKLEALEFNLLKKFQKGLSLNDLCKNAPENSPLKTLIPRWIQQRLITPDSPQESPPISIIPAT